MKTIITSLLVLLTLVIKAQTQTEKCLTPEMDTTEFRNLPWYDNNNYLEHFLDSIGYPAASSTNRIVGTPVRFWIPIKFWIYRDDNGIGGPNATQIQLLMDDLNRRYNQTNNAMIGFYMKCNPTFFNNSTHVNKTFVGASLLMAANNEGGCINVHIIGSFNSANTAGFSLAPFNASMIPTGAYTNPTANGDLAHEIGHVLGLVHTHQYSAWNWKCLTECVSRTRIWPFFNLCIPNRIKSKVVCESTGDGLRDTQADKNLLNNNSCNYNVSFGSDKWDDSYDNPPAGLQDRPNINNIMSYNSATNCVDRFSRLQIGVMLYTIIKKKPLSVASWVNPNYTFDNFEPDNEPLAARDILVGENQERNFHQSANTSGGVPFATQCDVDWVRYVPNCTANLAVTTLAIANKTNANTRLTLFNNTLVQLAQNDNISTTNLYSGISWNFVAGQVYFIRVENMQNLVTSYYNLLIGSANSTTINGGNGFCNTSNLYSVVGLTAGASVQWTATPNGLATINSPNAIQTTITKNVDGVITLTARITPVCGVPYDVNRTNVTSGKGATSLNFTRMVANCDAGPYLYAAYKPIPNELNCSWYKKDRTLASNPFVFLEDALDGTDYPLRQGNRSYIIRAVVTTPCGTITSDAVVFAPSCTGARILLSPNPVTSILNLSTIEHEETLKTVENNIQEVIVTDKMGIVMIQKKYAVGTKKIAMPVSNLRSDIYFVKTWDGKNWEVIQFVKE